MSPQVSRTTVPRSRAGRGPQLSDGTFEGRRSLEGTPKPQQFTVIAFAPNPFESVELWCYRKNLTGSFSGDEYDQIPATGSPPRPVAWFDQVAQNEEFEPDDEFAIDSTENIQNLKQFATDRFKSEFPGHQDHVDNWQVSVARPFQPSTGGTDTKIRKNKVYAVYQDDQLGTEPITTLTAWVWIPVEGDREIWLLYRRDQLGGFRVPGSALQGSSAKFQRTRFVFEFDPPATYEQWDISAYAATIELFFDHARSHPDSPVIDNTDLTVHDFRLAPLK